MRFLILLVAATLLPAQGRIVSTSPAITETLFALGLGGSVAAVSTYCHYPPEAAKLPKIGTYLKPNVEAIVRLRPDLVFIERLPNQAIGQLQSSGIRVVTLATGNVETNLRMIESIAAAANRPAAGRALAKRVRTELNEIAAASKSRSPKTVVFIVGRTPGLLEGMIAVGKGSYLNELISIAGGRNLLADSAASYPKISLEAMVRLQPEVIIDMGDMAETVGVTEQHKRSVEQLWRARKEIRGRAHAVADDIFVVPGPRMVEAAREFQRLILGVSR
ncbi:MAG: helical backbone metal receptor [Bryobacteraceae bacterium]|nr:helical backbone metal receptor [Bryobacteraceae bacterium]